MTAEPVIPAGGEDLAPDRSTARLFVAGNSAYSVVALASLRTVIQGMPATSAPDVIVIDVLQNPMAALEYRVYVTPTLVLTTPAGDAPAAKSTMIGDLSDGRKVSAFLARLLESDGVGPGSLG
jgi:hypothetical protein